MIISNSISGVIANREQCPAIPYTPEEYAAEARRVVGKLVPMILRAQKPDGGWGDGHSAITLRALATHGFFDKLRKLPPLPPDWKTVRTIPAPGSDVRTLAFGGTHLAVGWWGDALAVVQGKPKRLLKIDPATGRTLREVPLAKLEWPHNVADMGSELWVWIDSDRAARPLQQCEISVAVRVGIGQIPGHIAHFAQVL